jgi:serine/threonine-protein kinase
MVTAKRAFEGKTAASTIAAILAADPKPISATQPMMPSALERVVKACLEKDPDDRMQTAHDVRLQLRWIAEAGPRATPLPAATMRSMPGRRALILGLGALLLGAVIASLATWNLKPPPQQPVSRTIITLPPGQRLAGLDQPCLALSPDGNHLAYVSVQGGTQQLYLRAMDSLEARPVPGTEGATGPFFSPDGQWLGFFASGTLNKVLVSGGAVLTLGDVFQPRGASLGSQGAITFTHSSINSSASAGRGRHTASADSPCERGE